MPKGYTKLVMPSFDRPKLLRVGDIVFVGNRLFRATLVRKVKPGWGRTSERDARVLWEGRTAKKGKLMQFYGKSVRFKSPMSPLPPTVYPKPVNIGKHVDCGGTIWHSTTRVIGDRYCDKCRVDGRFGRPRPITEEEAKSNEDNQ